MPALNQRGLGKTLLERVPLLAGAVLILARSGIAFQPYEAAARGAWIRRRFAVAGWGLQIGRGVIIYGAEHIRLGHNVTLYDGVFLQGGGGITIGDNSHVDVYTSIYGHGGVTIGANCAVAAGVRIYSQSNTHSLGVKVPIIAQPRVYKAVVIDDDVWIGANAVILPGIRLGAHSVVAAGAVVTQNVAPATLVGGVPARPLAARS